jgi:hypothetical protein
MSNSLYCFGPVQGLSQNPSAKRLAQVKLAIQVAGSRVGFAIKPGLKLSWRGRAALANLCTGVAATIGGWQMSVEWSREGERLLVCRIKGQLSYADWQRLNQGDAGAAPARPGGQKLRALVLLEQFSGWERHDGWADLSWVDENDQRLDRVACVGEEQWRDDMEIFMLKDLRPVAVRYFAEDEENLARAWLEG